MSRPRKLSEEDVDAILSWTRLRKTRKQLAIDYGVSEATIKRLVSAGGYQEKGAITDEEFEALVR